MTSICYTLAFAVVSVLLLPAADAISCYTCDSAKDTNCNPVDASTDTQALCTKCKTVNNGAMVTRSCVSSCTAGTSSSGVTTTCCDAGDKCNDVNESTPKKRSCYQCTGSSCETVSSTTKKSSTFEKTTSGFWYSSSTATKKVCGVCKTSTTSSGIERSCTEPGGCVAYTSSTSETKCCEADDCNSDSVEKSGLECYDCSCKEISSTSNTKWGCKYCKVFSSEVSSFITLESTVRSCATTCSEGEFDLFGVKSKTSCCQTDKCNAAGGLRFSFLTLIASAVISRFF